MYLCRSFRIFRFTFLFQVYDAIEYLETQDPVDRLQHSIELEKAAKDFFFMDNPEDRLAERVEKYTNWDGELNEIVHYSRKGVSGRDVLINIMLSDERGSCNNKDIVFGYNFKYFGVKVGVNNTNEYCIVLDYASHLGNERYQEPITPRKILSSNEFIPKPICDQFCIEERYNFHYESKSSPYDINIDLKQRSASRRKVEYDPVENSIRHINQEVNQVLSDHSSERQQKSYVNQNYRAESTFKTKRKLTDEDFTSKLQRGDENKMYSQSCRTRKAKSNVRLDNQSERGFETPASNRFRVMDEDREAMYTPARTPKGRDTESRLV